jgi:hypothetical protein
MAPHSREKLFLKSVAPRLDVAIIAADLAQRRLARGDLVS